MIRFGYVDSPLGRLLVAMDGEAVHQIAFPGEDRAREGSEPEWVHDESAVREVAKQLARYFAGTLREFRLPLAPRGTPFQQAVWTALTRIPYGETCSYAEVARSISRPRAVRAVGAANGANPIPIIVPCHRVIGSDGSLTGFGGGVHLKQFLLDLERGSPRLFP